MFGRLLQPGRLHSAASLAVRNMSGGSGKKLAGKVAIVTASTDGIGFSIAQRLGQDGARVMVSSRKQQNVDVAVRKLKEEKLEVSGVVCHVGKAQDRKKLIDQTVSEFGGVDILISNAAVNPVFGPILNTSEEAWDKIFEINVKAAFLLCQEIVPHMEARKGGSIVLVSSIAGYQPLSALGAYSVSKTALLGLCKALAPELAHSGIRINVLAPGIIKTRFSEQLWKNESVGEMVLQSVPLGRFGEPEECAGAASFLVSNDARYITGETVMVTGGMNARL